MQSKRLIVTAISIALLVVAVGTSLLLGFANNRGVVASNASSETPAAFDLPGGRLVIDLANAQGSAFEITAKFESDDGSNDATLIEPNVSMTMVGHNMGRSLIPMYRQSDGAWRGTGNFSMRGQWRFRINFDDESFEIDHVAQ
jgi:hypothetical protein